jgi:hypothetical protein
MGGAGGAVPEVMEVPRRAARQVRAGEGQSLQPRAGSASAFTATPRDSL